MLLPSLDTFFLCLALSSGFAEALPKAPWVEQYARTRGKGLHFFGRQTQRH
jgi:hypothetical protein